MFTCNYGEMGSNAPLVDLVVAILAASWPRSSPASSMIFLAASFSASSFAARFFLLLNIVTSAL